MDRLYVFLVIAAIIISIGSIAIFYIESPNEKTQINSFLDAVWWTVSTVTTVGYGDIVPVTDAGKIMSIFFMIFGIGILAIALSMLGTRIYKTKIEKNEQDISHAQKLILQRIEHLEKSINEIRDSIKQNYSKE